MRKRLLLPRTLVSGYKLILLLVVIAFTLNAQEPGKQGSISADKLDYQPGDVVTITGQNWMPGETVDLVIHEMNTGAADVSLASTVANDGSFINQDFTIQQQHLGISFVLTAKGQSSGYIASLEFFDGIVYSGIAGDYTVTVQDNATLFPGTTDIGNHIDDGTTVLAVSRGTMPFPVKLYGQNFSYMALSSNGVLQFASNDSSYISEPLSDPKNLNSGAAKISMSVVPYWDDLTTAGNSPAGFGKPLGIFTSVEGSAPNRIFHIEWRTLHKGSATAIEQFEVRFFENNGNRFDIVYGRTDDQGKGASIGVVRDKNSNFTQYSFHSPDVRAGRWLIFNIAADTTAPTVTVPSNMTVQATGSSGEIVTFTATAMDAVDGALTPTCTPASGSTFQLGTTLVTCEATDAAGNKGSATFNIRVVDTSAPVGPVGQVVNAEATSAAGAPVQFTSVAHDIVDGDIAGTCTPASGTTFKLGSTPVNCQATDKAGNTGTWMITVHVGDSTAPQLTVPTDFTQEATSAAGATVTFSATASDSVDGILTPICAPASGTTFKLGPTAVMCTATDQAGNRVEATFNITVRDTTPPTLTVPLAEIINEATSAAGAATSFTVAATDLVDASPIISCSRNSGDTFPLGTTVVSCTARDAAGNISTAKTFNITIRDTTPPSLTVPGNITKEATSAAGALASFTASANDIVDGVVVPVCTPASGSTFALGDTTVTCVATDKAGNQASGSFTVKVEDTTPPALTVPDNITTEATSAAGAAVTYSSSATDIVDGVVVPVCTPASGSTFALGNTTVTCVATDKAGNQASASFTVKVEDTTPPVLTVPENITKEATSALGAIATFSSSAVDIVDGAVTPICTPASGSTFALGNTTVTCVATDKAGNQASASFTVKVEDTTPPALTVPGNITQEATSAAGAFVSFTASASDIVDGAVTPICTPASSSTFALGNTTVTCVATDKTGNQASASFTVRVQDTTPPAITVPANITAEATSAAGATVTYSSSATDIVDGVVTTLCAPASGTTFALGTTTVTCLATDKAGNQASASFTIKVQDTTAPVLTLPGDIAVYATSSAGALVTYQTSAHDLVSGSVATTCVLPSGSTFPAGLNTVNCSAVDAAGNHVSGTFHVNVTFAWSNFLQPINTDSSSIFKLGSTVPVKFQLTGPSAAVTNVVAKLYVAKVSNQIIGTELEAVTSTPASVGNLFRYESGLYIYNWGTKSGYTTGTYQIRVDLGDGVSHTVLVTLR